MIPLSAIVLGLINIAIWVAILVLIGAMAMWLLGLLGYAIPANVQKLYLLIVALVALYMLAALAFGLPVVRIVSADAWLLAG